MQRTVDRFQTTEPTLCDERRQTVPDWIFEKILAGLFIGGSLLGRFLSIFFR